MNERIKELMVQSGAFDHYEINEGVDGDELPMQKFAELIVKNVCNIVLHYTNVDEGVAVAKKHFGVEE